MGSFDRIDDQFTAFQASGRSPGVVWGVVEGGALVHSGAAGVASIASPAAGPTGLSSESVFRIASMTKSFTAAAVLLLRDRQQLALDDLVADHLPELRWLPLPTADSAPLTIRHLLTMSGGLPTDDPWADRLESLSAPEFSALLSNGLTFVAPPGIGYAYSNLGFAILGRVIDNVVSEGFRTFVHSELLVPLGLTSTTFNAAEVHPDLLVTGHRKVEQSWVAVPFSYPGAFSPIGGLLSSVADLARWVAGFLDAYPPRDDAAGAHPLSRASRREMQQLHRHIDVVRAPNSADATGYGFGLVVEQFADHGQVVSHAGGYPGFGSRMRWHPATGIGVITLSNGRYAGAEQPARDALRELVAGRPAEPLVLSPATARAVENIDRLLDAFSETGAFPTAAGDLFAENVELDVPPAERVAALTRATALVGRVLAGSDKITSADSAHAAWTRPATHGHLEIELRTTPERNARIQSLRIVAIPEPE